MKTNSIYCHFLFLVKLNMSFVSCETQYCHFLFNCYIDSLAKFTGIKSGIILSIIGKKIEHFQKSIIGKKKEAY